MLSEDKRATAFILAPKSKLSPYAEQAVLNICCQKEYADLPPTQIVSLLLDKGIWHGCESTYYRILRRQKIQNHRGKSDKLVKRHPPRLSANKPNDV